MVELIYLLLGNLEFLNTCLPSTLKHFVRTLCPIKNLEAFLCYESKGWSASKAASIAFVVQGQFDAKCELHVLQSGTALCLSTYVYLMPQHVT